MPFLSSKRCNQFDFDVFGAEYHDVGLRSLFKMETAYLTVSTSLFLHFQLLVIMMDWKIGFDHFISLLQSWRLIWRFYEGGLFDFCRQEKNPSSRMA